MEHRTVQRLPFASTTDPLTFRCNGCGACCKSLRVALTHHDLRRLASELSTPAALLVDWLTPEEVDMIGEPESFVELSAGRRLMVLRHRAGSCQLLDRDRCSGYAARPLDCELFPFDLSRDSRGRVTQLSLLQLDGCNEEPGPRGELASIERTDARRWAELADYQREVARWNRLSRHRRRFGRSAGSPADLLQFLGC